jgi:hypothetical protein
MLKVVCNENQGLGKMANVRYWYRTAAIKVYLPYNFVAVFSLVYFRFRQVKEN